MNRHHAALARAHSQRGLTLLREDTLDASPTDFRVKLTIIKEVKVLLTKGAGNSSLAGSGSPGLRAHQLLPYPRGDRRKQECGNIKSFLKQDQI